MHGASVGWALAHQQADISRRWTKAHPTLRETLEPASINHVGAGLPARLWSDLDRGQARSYSQSLAAKRFDNSCRINSREANQ